MIIVVVCVCQIFHPFLCNVIINSNVIQYIKLQSSFYMEGDTKTVVFNVGMTCDVSID